MLEVPCEGCGVLLGLGRGPSALLPRGLCCRGDTTRHSRVMDFRRCCFYRSCQPKFPKAAGTPKQHWCVWAPQQGWEGWGPAGGTARTPQLLEGELLASRSMPAQTSVGNGVCSFCSCGKACLCRAGCGCRGCPVELLRRTLSSQGNGPPLTSPPRLLALECNKLALSHPLFIILC